MAFSNLSGSASLSQLPSIANLTALGNISGASTTPSAIPVRKKLTGTLNMYLATTGADTSDCTNVAAPCLTRQYAYNYVQQNIDMAGQIVIVNMAAGTYSDHFTATGPIEGDAGARFNFIGVNGNAAAVIINDTTAGYWTFNLQYGASMVLQWLTVGGSGLGGGAVSVGGGRMDVYNVNFAAANSRHVEVAGGNSWFIQQDTITITGDSPYFIVAESGATVSLTKTVVASGTRTFSSAFVVSNAGSTIETIGLTCSGTFVGSRYDANTGGYINANSTTSLCGNAAGSTSSGFYTVSTPSSTYTGTGVFALQTTPTFISPSFGSASSAANGSFLINGSTSGTITAQPQAAAGTYNWNWPTTAGSAGDCLKSAGGGASAMTWGACAAASGAALTKGDDTNVTLTLGGSPTTALVNAASITAGWTGTLALARGGTGANLTASNGGIVYSGASAFAVLAGTATANQMLLSGSSTTPAWSTNTWPTTAAAGTLLTAATANTITASATPTLGANGGTGGQITLNGSTSGSAQIKVPAVAGSTVFQLPSGNGSSGQFLKTDGSGSLSWDSPAGAGTVTSVTCNGGTTTITSSGTCASREVLGASRAYFVATNGSDSNTGLATATSATVTFTNGSANITWTSHGRSAGDLVYFTTTGALPTNFTVAPLPYYVKTVVDVNTITVSLTNGGTAITAGSAGSGTQTVTLLSPYATVQKGINTTLTLDLNGNGVSIYVAGGTYSESPTVTSPFVGGNVTIVGNTASPSTVLFSTTSTTFYVSNGATLYLQGLKIASSGGYAIQADTGATININGAMEYGASNVHMSASILGRIVITANYTISGNAFAHWSGYQGGAIRATSITVTLSGTPAFTAFAYGDRGVQISVESNTFSGSATGSRYNVSSNGVVFTNGGGANYLPGNSGGSTATGGQYI